MVDFRGRVEVSIGSGRYPDGPYGGCYACEYAGDPDMWGNYLQADLYNMAGGDIFHRLGEGIIKYDDSFMRAMGDHIASMPPEAFKFPDLGSILGAPGGASGAPSGPPPRDVEKLKAQHDLYTELSDTVKLDTLLKEDWPTVKDKFEKAGLSQRNFETLKKEKAVSKDDALKRVLAGLKQQYEAGIPSVQERKTITDAKALFEASDFKSKTFSDTKNTLKALAKLLGKPTDDKALESLFKSYKDDPLAVQSMIEELTQKEQEQKDLPLLPPSASGGGAPPPAGTGGGTP